MDCLTQLLGEDPVVFEHLSSLHILPSLPFSKLWGQGLSQLFHPTLLPRLWDKVLSFEEDIVQLSSGDWGECQGAGLRVSSCI